MSMRERIQSSLGLLQPEHLEVLADHAPFMTALREGAVTVVDGGSRRVFEVRGGFADVTPAGLTILAEEASERPAA